MKRRKMSSDHSHSYQLLKRKMREEKDKKIPVAALVSTMRHPAISGEIAMDLEEDFVGSTAFMLSKQRLNQVVIRKQMSKGHLCTRM